MTQRQAEYSAGNDIVFDAVVYKVATLVDNGIRVTFDLPEDAVMQAAQMMELHRRGIPLIIAVKQVVSDYGQIPEGSIRKSKRTAPEE